MRMARINLFLCNWGSFSMFYNSYLNAGVVGMLFCCFPPYSTHTFCKHTPLIPGLLLCAIYVGINLNINCHRRRTRKTAQTSKSSIKLHKSNLTFM